MTRVKIAPVQGLFASTYQIQQGNIIRNCLNLIGCQNQGVQACTCPWETHRPLLFQPIGMSRLFPIPMAI
jgi:hypothetical protein